MTLPHATLLRSSDRECKSKDELENEGENEVFASKYCAEVSVNWF